MRILNRLTFAQKLLAQMAVFIAVFLMFFVWSTKTLASIEVSGPIYRNVLQSKDLIADILPPPAYIIESYLTVLEIERASSESVRRAKIARLQELRNEYESRLDFWSKQDLGHEISSIFLDRAHKPAEAFYKVALSDFIPAIQSGDRVRVHVSMLKMEESYLAHRHAIDEVVEIASNRHVGVEEFAKEQISSSYRLLYFVLCLCITFGIGFSVLIARSLKQSLGAEPSQLSVISQRIAGGDLNFELNVTAVDSTSVLSQIEKMRQQLKLRSSQEKAQHLAELRAADAESELRMVKLNATLEQEKREIYISMVRAAQHVLNNLLNQLQLFKLVADRSRDFDREILGLFDDVAKESSDLMGRLSSVTEVRSENIAKSVAP